MSLLLVAALLSADPSVQAGIPAPAVQAAAPTTSPAPAPKMKEKKICKTQDAESGSHMNKRVCLTENQWNLVADGVNLTGRQVQTSDPNDH
jgi:hypothetical protein